MAKVFLLSALLVGLLLFVANASRNTQHTYIVLVTDKESDVTYIVEGSREGSNEAAGLNVVIPSKHDTYCCLRNAFGCLQKCDSNINYFCCLKNAIGGCLQMCDSSKKHYCCKKNLFGTCVEMCPKTIFAILLLFSTEFVSSIHKIVRWFSLDNANRNPQRDVRLLWQRVKGGKGKLVVDQIQRLQACEHRQRWQAYKQKAKVLPRVENCCLHEPTHPKYYSIALLMIH
ncbi:hypothetical protein SELMODRAFT_404114 [Selaginella moellendorffii]|uniref:Uncharacterized protein n=1 Tax=Selaginella moellendorffii TaxID=88036 RepID=D8QUB6_SELML|nr:hypothetical protein SELMODRAFT_404114 [Selaginella moellendorffii]